MLCVEALAYCIELYYCNMVHFSFNEMRHPSLHFNYITFQFQPLLPSARQHPSYGDCLEVKREYYQNSSVLNCVTQCSQSAAHLYEQFLQVKQIGFVTLGRLRCA